MANADRVATTNPQWGTATCKRVAVRDPGVGGLRQLRVGQNRPRPGVPPQPSPIQGACRPVVTAVSSEGFIAFLVVGRAAAEASCRLQAPAEK